MRFAKHTKVIIFISSVLFTGLVLVLARQIQASLVGIYGLEAENTNFLGNIYVLKQIHTTAEGYFTDYSKLYPDLPGLSTAQHEFYYGLFSEAVLANNYESAFKDLVLAQNALKLVLQDQDRIVSAETRKVEDSISENLVVTKSLFLNTAPWEEELLAGTEGENHNIENLKKLQKLQSDLVEAINLRRLQSSEAVKSIVIKRSELKMFLYEDEKMLYSLPLSLGRAGYGTRLGQFTVLDKMGTIWGYWQIYLPYWMGIYYAGASENGIHGLPWDKAGNIYWRESIGRENATYGCVMGLDGDIAKVYDWVEVGTAVTIIN